MKWNIEALEDQQNTYKQTPLEYFGSSCSSYLPDSVVIAESLSIQQVDPINLAWGQIRCRYCITKNEQNDVYCIGCGAPL